MTEKPEWRPPAEERWIDGMRTEPGVIRLRTRWLYSEHRAPEIVVPAGRTTHPFSRGGEVVESDFPSRYAHMQGVTDHLWRAIAAFGDDKDIEIVVRLAEPSGAVR